MSTPTPGRRRRRVAVALVAAGSTVLTGVLVGLLSAPATASSHREAPLIAGDPPADNTDVYAFVSPDKSDSVTLIANWYPFQEPNGGPNFYPWATETHHDINIDNDGDAKADVTYRWTFKAEDRRGKSTFLYNNGPVTSLDDENLLFRQTYTLEKIGGKGGSRTLIRDGRVAPSNTGAAGMPDYRALRDQAVVDVPGGGRTYAGQADDSFFLDLRVFDLLYGGNLSEVGQDTLAGYSVNTIALQVPKSEVVLGEDPVHNPVIGVWSDTERRSMLLQPGVEKPFGKHVQVSRLGNPLVNEVVVPAGLKDRFNSLTPDQDRKVPELVSRVTDPELPKLIEGIYGIPAPATPRADLAEIFLTGITTKVPGPIKADLNSQLNNADVNPARFVPSEQLRLNVEVPPAASPNRLGVLGGDLQGYPNGRRLTDDVLDIAVQAVEGAAVSGIVPALATGDKVDANDKAFGTSFPHPAAQRHREPAPPSEVHPHVPRSRPQADRRRGRHRRGRRSARRQRRHPVRPRPGARRPGDRRPGQVRSGPDHRGRAGDPAAHTRRLGDVGAAGHRVRRAGQGHRRPHLLPQGPGRAGGVAAAAGRGQRASADRPGRAGQCPARLHRRPRLGAARRPGGTGHRRGVRCARRRAHPSSARPRRPPPPCSGCWTCGPGWPRSPAPPTTWNCTAASTTPARRWSGRWPRR